MGKEGKHKKTRFPSVCSSARWDFFVSPPPSIGQEEQREESSPFHFASVGLNVEDPSAIATFGHADGRTNQGSRRVPIPASLQANVRSCLAASCVNGNQWTFPVRFSCFPLLREERISVILLYHHSWAEVNKYFSPANKAVPLAKTAAIGLERRPQLSPKRLWLANSQRWLNEVARVKGFRTRRAGKTVGVTYLLA